MCDVFFFQAEDGIRDLVRSRGLGDVYKRQGHTFDPAMHEALQQVDSPEHPPGTVIVEYEKGYRQGDRLLRPAPVSYTHLTLPTSDLV